MQRREFIILLGGAAAAWPLAARAQQGERMRRVGVLTGAVEGDPILKANLTAMWEALAKLGWVEGRNLRIDLRFAAGDPVRVRASAAELASLAPDVIVICGTSLAIRVMQEVTRSIPIVFAEGPDPVAAGIVQSLARPEGNTTGFANLEPSFSGKWVELLKEAAPHLTRVALIRNPDLGTPGASLYSATIETAAQASAVRTIELPVVDPIEIVRAIDAFAAEPNGGLIVLPPPPISANRDVIIRLAAQHRLPAIYVGRDLAAAGGLMSYGSNFADQYRRASTYVDRLLRGAKVSELPVQFPTRYELVVNLKAAKAIGLTIPEAFLLRADELIE